MDIGEFDFLRKDEILEILCNNFIIPYKLPFTKMKDIIYSIVELLSTTDLKILEIIKKVNETYNVKYVMNYFTKDMYHYMVNIMSESIGMPNIKEKYEIDYEDLKERMFFRIELYKDGWEPEQIEKYICKYILKCDYHNTDKDLVINMYHNIMEKLKINNKNKPKKVGRPNLPETLKNYIKGKHSEKTKKNMDLTYDYSKKYKQIKDNLLTEDEYKILYEYLNTFPEKLTFNQATTMIEKLRNLKIDDNI